MRKLPYQPYDEEDYQIMEKIIKEKDKKFRPNESYIRTSKEIIIQRPYDKIKSKDSNGNEQ